MSQGSGLVVQREWETLGQCIPNIYKGLGSTCKELWRTCKCILGRDNGSSAIPRIALLLGLLPVLESWDVQGARQRTPHTSKYLFKGGGNWYIWFSSWNLKNPFFSFTCSKHGKTRGELPGSSELWLPVSKNHLSYLQQQHNPGNYVADPSLLLKCAGITASLAGGLGTIILRRRNHKGWMQIECKLQARINTTNCLLRLRLWCCGKIVFMCRRNKTYFIYYLKWRMWSSNGGHCMLEWLLGKVPG